MSSDEGDDIANYRKWRITIVYVHLKIGLGEKIYTIAILFMKEIIKNW